MSSEPGWPEDAAFARRLLDSARGDPQPGDAGEAWARFAGTLSALVPEARGNVGAPPASVGNGLPVSVAVSGAVGVARLPWFTAVKWLMLGGIAGAGLTAGLPIELRPPVVERAVAEPTPTGALTDEPPPAFEATVDRRSVRPETDTEKNVPRAPRHHPFRASAFRASAPARAAVTPSTLAAEVSRIDDARAALAAGDPAESTRLIERYHDDFPSGALAPDADVVGLEAAAANHDRSEVVRGARRFLMRYPNDPHAARIRALREQAREEKM